MPILTTLGLAAALASPPVLPAASNATVDPAFSRCLAGLQATAATQGISPDRFNEITAGLTPDPSVLGLLDAQPEFTTPIWDYLAALVDRQRVADGRAMLQQHRDLLDRVSAQYGVDPATILGLVQRGHVPVVAGFQGVSPQPKRLILARISAQRFPQSTGNRHRLLLPVKSSRLRLKSHPLNQLSSLTVPHKSC